MNRAERRARAAAQLEELAPPALAFDHPLGASTALGTGGSVWAWCEPEDREQLLALGTWSRRNRVPLVPVGSLNQTVILDGGWPVLAISLRRMARTIEELAADGSVLGERVDEDEVRLAPGARFSSAEAQLDALRARSGPVALRVGAAVSLAALMGVGVASGDSRYADLVALPGTVAGGILVGAGLPRLRWKQLVQRVELLRGGAALWLPVSEVFLRGQPALKRGDVVLRVELGIRSGSFSRALKRARAVWADRVTSQPDQPGAVGPCLKDPGRGRTAEAVAEDLGVPGVRLRGIRISQQNANYLCNEGAGRAHDARLLLGYVRKRARELAGVALEERLLFVGKEA